MLPNTFVEVGAVMIGLNAALGIGSVNVERVKMGAYLLDGSEALTISQINRLFFGKRFHEGLPAQWLLQSLRLGFSR